MNNTTNEKKKFFNKSKSGLRKGSEVLAGILLALFTVLISFYLKNVINENVTESQEQTLVAKTLLKAEKTKKPALSRGELIELQEIASRYVSDDEVTLSGTVEDALSFENIDLKNKKIGTRDVKVYFETDETTNPENYVNDALAVYEALLDYMGEYNVGTGTEAPAGESEATLIIEDALNN